MHAFIIILEDEMYDEIMHCNSYTNMLPCIIKNNFLCSFLATKKHFFQKKNVLE